MVGGSRFFIIGTGPSTAKLLPHKDKIRSKFDVVLGLNFAIRDFEDQLDFHFVLEKEPDKIHKYMKENGYRKDLPRILNPIPARFFPNNINKITCPRSWFKCSPDIRKYEHNGEEGLFSGYLSRQTAQPGTVLLQAIHFAGIFGATEIYTIGADFVFRDGDRYYKGYNGTDHKNSISGSIVIPKQIVEVEHKGQIKLTNDIYRDTALWTNRFIDEQCKPNNIKVVDFSDGLLTSAQQMDIDNFME